MDVPVQLVTPDHGELLELKGYRETLEAPERRVHLERGEEPGNQGKLELQE